jgi:hypothetical protein
MTHSAGLSMMFCFGILILQTTLFSQSEPDYVDGTVHKIIDGAWCWFQDERAVVDAANGKLVVGTANMQRGVDLTIFDIESKRVESSKRFTLPSKYYSDDHNSPGLLIAPNGKYLALWAHHYDEYNTRYSIYNGQEWSAENQFKWNSIPGGTNFTICYSNVYYLSAEKRIYDFAHANDKAPNFLYFDELNLLLT